MTPSPLNILVIGAGIAGPAACYWLNKFGFSPVLIEKSPSIRQGGQALDLRGVTIPLAKKMGIYKKACTLRTQIKKGQFVDREGQVLHEEAGEHFGFRQEGEVELLRGDLIGLLMDLIPNTPVRFETEIQHIAQNQNGVTVEYLSGESETYHLIIGADGIHSSTRRMAFDRSEYQLVNMGAYLSTFTLPNYLNLDHTEVEYEAQSKFISLNSDKNPHLARAGLMLRTQEELKNARDRNEQKDFLRKHFHDFGWESNNILAHLDHCGDFYFDSITQVKMESWSKGRVALIGDAGYCASPLSGQGNNLALVGAYVLAGELKKSHGDYEEAFKNYDELMRPFVEANQKFGQWVSESFLTENTLSETQAAERITHILSKMARVSNGITLPDYD